LALSLLKPRTSSHLQTWLDWLVFERGLSPRTIQGYEREMRRLGPRVLRLTTDDLRERLNASPNDSISTRNGRIAAWSSFYRKAVREGWRKDDPTANIDRQKAKRGIPHPVRDLADKLAELPPMYRLIMVLFWQTGMRLSEACDLSIEEAVSDRDWIDVIGKGSKERRIPLTKLGHDVLLAIAALPHPDHRVHLLLPVGPRAIEHWFREVGTHPHALRHTFACDMAEADVREFVLQDLLGHASPATTRVYVATSERRLREGMDKFEAAG
jgi:site-specific recombinase XerD